MFYSCINLSDFAKMCPLGFRLDSGAGGKRGAGAPSRLTRVYSLANMAYLSAGSWGPTVKSRGQERVSCTDTSI